jgi:hypothetical protein
MSKSKVVVKSVEHIKEESIKDLKECESGILYGLGGASGLEVVSSYMLGVVIKLNRWLVSEGSSVSLNEMILYVKSSGYLVSDSCDRKVVVVGGKSKCIIPFCGSKISGRCSGIKLNYGLYSQCMNEISDSDVYCKTCSKQGVKSGTGKPTYGDISERINKGKEWRDKKGKEAVRYANVMDKLEISREQAEKEASRFGLTIPEIEFEMKEVKRGRPKKSVEVSDTESEISVEPKKRGRPRKEKQVVSSLSPGDDLIAGLIKSAKSTVASEGHMPTFLDNAAEHVANNVHPDAQWPDELREKAATIMADAPEVKSEVKPKPSSPQPSSIESDDEEDEQEVEVEKFTDPKTGIEYYKTEDNILYSMDSEPLGRWNPDTKEVEQVLDLEEDED